jgi:hypothetical protein
MKNTLIDKCRKAHKAAYADLRKAADDVNYAIVAYKTALTKVNRIADDAARKAAIADASTEANDAAAYKADRAACNAIADYNAAISACPELEAKKDAAQRVYIAAHAKYLAARTAHKKALNKSAQTTTL